MDGGSGLEPWPGHKPGPLLDLGTYPRHGRCWGPRTWMGAPMRCAGAGDAASRSTCAATRPAGRGICPPAWIDATARPEGECWRTGGERMRTGRDHDRAPQPGREQGTARSRLCPRHGLMSHLPHPRWTGRGHEPPLRFPASGGIAPAQLGLQLGMSAPCCVADVDDLLLDMPGYAVPGCACRGTPDLDGTAPGSMTPWAGIAWRGASHHEHAGMVVCGPWTGLLGGFAACETTGRDASPGGQGLRLHPRHIRPGSHGLAPVPRPSPPTAHPQPQSQPRHQLPHRRGGAVRVVPQTAQRPIRM